MSKRIPKEGDDVLVRVKVILGADREGDCRIDLGASKCGERHAYVSAERCTVITDELKVGDLAKVKGNDSIRKVVQRLVAYRLDWADGSSSDVLRPGDDITKIPPKPTYTFNRQGDYLQLLPVIGDGGMGLVRSVALDDPENVKKTIAEWVEEFGCDGDEARRLVAEPRLLKSITITPSVRVVAVRCEKGWVAKVNRDQNTTPSHIMLYGEPLTKAVAEAHFPDVKGPYTEPCPKPN